MFGRKEIKAHAKTVLHANLVVLILALLVALGAPSIAAAIVSGIAGAIIAVIGAVLGADTFAIALLVWILFGVIYLAVGVIGAVLTLSYQRMSLKVYDGDEPKFEDLLVVRPYWWKLLCLYVVMIVRILLWSLLLYVPGIIASFSYSQAIYIFFDDPTKGITQCIDESKAMMKGNKMTLFVFQLSFFWWSCLTAVTFGIAMFYVFPYMQVSYAGFYRSLVPAPVAPEVVETFEAALPLEEVVPVEAEEIQA